MWMPAAIHVELLLPLAHWISAQSVVASIVHHF
jgi:hypothetical protein